MEKFVNVWNIKWKVKWWLIKQILYGYWEMKHVKNSYNFLWEKKKDFVIENWTCNIWAYKISSSVKSCNNQIVKQIQRQINTNYLDLIHMKEKF